jgi:NADPH:quinone reductase-like Zn-dependent oxidoreductase
MARVSVRRSTMLDAPVEAVWAVLRDFNSHAAWHPAIADSVIEDGAPSDTVGCVRRFHLRDAEGVLREQLLWLDDRAHALRYALLTSPLPLREYVATMQLRPVTDGGATFWTWESRFTAPEAEAQHLAGLVGDGIYQAGFDALRRMLRTPAPSVRSAPAAMPAAAANRAGAVVVARFGGPEVLEWQEMPVRPPGPGEVRIRHTAIGVNFIDIYTRSGAFQMIEPPAVPGMEAAGIVVATGEGAYGLREGDRVGYACAPPGAYVTERTMPAELVVRLPDELDDVTAAAVLLKGMTAEFLLHRVHRGASGETVLVHAAAGGTGLLLCQWASALGTNVIGVVSSEAKARLARAHGAAQVVVTASEDFVARLHEITSGRGCDVVYDGVGQTTFLRSYEALATCGHLVSFGQASGGIAPVDIAGFAAKSATVSRPNFGHYTDTREKVSAITARLFAALRGGILRVPPPRTLPLREAAAAHRALESRETTGATVLIP